MYAARTGQISGWPSSVTKVCFWPFCLCFCIWNVTLSFFGKSCGFTVQWVDAPISWEKGFYSSLAWRIDMFVNPWLSFLCIFGATQTSNLYEDHPISNVCFKAIGGWMYCHLEKAGKHLFRNGALLSGNVLFFFSCKDNPRAHVCPIGQVSWWLEIAELKKLVDRIDMSTYCCGAGVIVQC